MSEIKDVNWFKKSMAPALKGYEIKYKFFEEGDFGSLNQVEFNSDKLGGTIDFWGLGWLGVFVWDYKIENQIMNILLEPEKFKEQEKALMELQTLLST